MAMQPKSFTGREMLQPGARGGIINPSLPGYRDGADRINRTNNNLPTSDHDVPNIKWEMDRRLPVLFKYGYAFGYNQLTMPKGRIVAIDPHINQLDFDTKKAYNVITLANGGSFVKRRDKKDAQDHKQWETVKDTKVVTSDNEEIYVSNPAKPDQVTIDPNTGKVALNGAVTDEYRAPNTPIGVIQRNEYTRDNDAYNGMMVSPVLTDALVELPFFLDKAKAEMNPWGSAYGNILPGDLLKSDENGRLTVSPLSRMDILNGYTPSGDSPTPVPALTAAQIEIERQQVVGQVLEVSRDLLPAGAAKYATWALSDRMNFNEFNPMELRANNRNGEDLNENSPFTLQGGGTVSTTTNMTDAQGKFPGFPYDNTMTENDLHMVGKSLRNSDLRMPLEYQLEMGIPGLTDGYNAVIRDFGPEQISQLHKAGAPELYQNVFARTSKVGIEPGSMQLAITNQDKKDATYTTVTVGSKLDVNIFDTTSKSKSPAATLSQAIQVKYLNELQGLMEFEIVDKAKWDEFLQTNADKLVNNEICIFAKFKKRGLAGVPTFLDWDGCQGYVSVLFQR